jgi:hypothetical protein
MTDTEAKQLLLEILEQAQEGKSIKFQFIKSWAEFRYYHRLKLSTTLVIKTLKASANNLFTEYCQDVIDGISDLNKLLAYSQLRDIIAFYEKDIETLQQMLAEYDEYLGEGNFWYSFLGGERYF